MQKKKKKRINRNLIIISLVAIAAILVFCLPVFRSSSFEQGIAYLRAQDTVEIGAIQKKLSENRIKRISTQIDEGTLDFSGFFADSVLLGDSRMKDFKGYGYLPEGRVLAELGYTILNIDDYLDTVEALEPENIFISYGVNDMDSRIGQNNGADGFKEMFAERVKRLQEVSPDSRIFINSIIPVTAYALAEDGNLLMMDDYNRQIREMCKENGWYLVDNSNLTPEILDPYYEQDGIHFRADFLPVWAKQMVETAIRVET